MKPDIAKIMEGAASAQPDEDDGKAMDLEDAGQDVLDAMKAGDAKALTGALRDFFSMCDSGSSAGE